MMANLPDLKSRFAIMTCLTLRATRFVRTISLFLEKIGFLWEKFPVDSPPPSLHSDNRSTSILDNLFVNKNLIDFIKDVGPVHPRDNRSRHSPIMMKLDLKNIPTRAKQPEVLMVRKPAWYKASEENENVCTDLLEEKLPLVFRCQLLHAGTKQK